MKMVRKPKLLSSIRAKLFSAVAMLLVAVIMVVSSTYAWFTLSTAPEVTGMTTAIGANGSLEMALMPKDGVYEGEAIGSEIGKSLGTEGADKDAANRTWGNMVDMNDSSYGLSSITLYPAALNLDGDTTIPASPLKTPVYGDDGRVDSLSANTVMGTYNVGDSAFFPVTSESDNKYGLRGIGVSSSMTARELAWRGAMSTAATANSTAQDLAAKSISTEGSILAGIVIKKALNDAPTFSQDEVNALINMADKLTAAITTIESAYAQYVLVYATSSLTPDPGTWTVVKNAIEEGTFVFGEGGDVTISGTTVTLPPDLSGFVVKLLESKADVATAKEALNQLTPQNEDGTFSWSQIQTPLSTLANPDSMTVNGYTPAQIKENPNVLIKSISNLTVEMTNGAGVYADIAEHCGDYSSSVEIPEFMYSGQPFGPLPATMATKAIGNGATQVQTPYLDQIRAIMSLTSAPADTTNSMPLTEFYGYILDLVFRTNATESNLLLQTDNRDRIYENNSNDDTLGYGSTMTFKSASPAFTDDQVKDLMRCIRIVFFTPIVSGGAGDGTGTVLAHARLDVDNATAGAEGFTAKMYLTGEDETMITTQADAKITSLTQNQATAVSVLVYLDGTRITNADVATTATSLTGKMNLQFSSSATLVPMEYGNLHQNQNAGSDTTAQGGENADPQG